MAFQKTRVRFEMSLFSSKLACSLLIRVYSRVPVSEYRIRRLIPDQVVLFGQFNSFDSGEVAGKLRRDSLTTPILVLKSTKL